MRHPGTGEIGEYWLISMNPTMFLSAAIRREMFWTLILHGETPARLRGKPRYGLSPKTCWLVPVDIRDCLKTLAGFTVCVTTGGVSTFNDGR